MFYRSIDEVLMEAYSYEGTFTNLCYLADCFAILNAIIHKGYNLKQTKINIFYEYFDQFCVDCFQELLQDLLENNIEFQIQINRSYVKQYCKEGVKHFYKLICSLKPFYWNLPSILEKFTIIALNFIPMLPDNYNRF